MLSSCIPLAKVAWEKVNARKSILLSQCCSNGCAWVLEAMHNMPKKIRWDLILNKQNESISTCVGTWSFAYYSKLDDEIKIPPTQQTNLWPKELLYTLSMTRDISSVLGFTAKPICWPGLIRAHLILIFSDNLSYQLPLIIIITKLRRHEAVKKIEIMVEMHGWLRSRWSIT